MTPKHFAPTTGFVARYWASCNTPPVAARYLKAPFHPIRPKVVHSCAQRDPNTLWWRVSTTKITTTKRVVRSWCARRVRLAFEQALKQHGLDKLGKPLVSESPLQNNILKGTLEIYIHPPCVTEDFESIQKGANVVVSGLLAHGSTQTSTQTVNGPQPKVRRQRKVSGKVDGSS
ncbi:uncharacterized protein N7515_002291 [Penicillium bovifimosum]|uniref:Uncharacterized protein n=1 Tax=Penicillium bovifimosum TaxID=126998 RepID=A0A9W9L9J0_9EURO|nr:uncharacterized protein N7515_002291 [Penicillium bovifimosum]KAJ5143504.1 hypothetical protein N7515_002291 [Penicillium bovifimosum]